MVTVDSEVIVIGVGIAGLAAARLLQQPDREVIVLEARDRLGGRAWSMKQGESTLEMGAGWIHGQTDNPMVELANSINSRLTSDTDWEDVPVYSHNGERIDNPEQLYDRWEEVIYEHHEWFREKT